MQIERERLQAEQIKNQDEMMMRGREMQGRETMETAKIQHMQQREMGGLV